MFRNHTLSLQRGFAGFSEAKTHASAFLPTNGIHFRSSFAVWVGSATVRREDVVFGVSMSPR
jgi:hypothetical protein